MSHKANAGMALDGGGATGETEEGARAFSAKQARTKNLEDLDRRQFAGHIEAMLPFELKKKATTQEAKAKAGYNKLQWDRFYNITKAEINALVEANPEIDWPSVPGNVLADIYGRVNAQLQAEHIPEVQYDVFSWRMARAIQYRTSASGKSGAKPTETAAAGPNKDAEHE